MITNALNTAIKNALDSSGAQQDANKAYLEFIKANFLIPIHQHSAASAPEVLFLQEANQVFLPVFTDKQTLDAWAVDIADAIEILHLSGVDLLKGLGQEVTVCLNIGSPLYKEFNPSELARMRSIILKIFKS